MQDLLADWITTHDFKVVGVQGIQGSGKTTTCRRVVDLLNKQGRPSTTLSLDDFYKTHAELGGVWRGHPGTHDLDRMHACILSLTTCDETRVPVYDKTMHEGRGDRVGVRTVTGGPFRHVLVEGWCIAFQPLAVPPTPALQDVNLHLSRQRDQIFSLFDACVVFDSDPHKAYEWRERAEAESRALGLPAMTPDEVRSFVDHYMPVYKGYMHTLDDVVQHLPVYHHVVP